MGETPTKSCILGSHPCLFKVLPGKETRSMHALVMIEEIVPEQAEGVFLREIPSLRRDSVRCEDPSVPARGADRIGSVERLGDMARIE